MSRKYRFSLVVPTRNRAGTLKSTLQTCLNQLDFDDYEIIINDNGDDEVTKSYVQRLMSSNPQAAARIKYHKRTSVCSMSRNFEDAIAKVRGEYIIVLGDDDGIMPMALSEIDRILKDTGAAVLRWRNGLYNWPNMNLQDSANYLGFSLERSMTVRDGRAELAKALEALSYETLPMLYVNAAVKADFVQNIRDGEGRLFRSRSPDVYSAVAISYFCGDYLDVSAPLTLAGLSFSSNGVSTAFGGDNPRPRTDFLALNAKDGIHHHGDVPTLTIFPVIDVADSFYLAKGYYFSSDETMVLPRERVMRACVERCDVSDPEIRRELLRVCKDSDALTAYVLDLMSQNLPRKPTPRLKPSRLGAEGVNLHLDASEFGVQTVAEAVALVHKIIWPNNAPLRFEHRPA